ncbi:ATP-dependent DNA helicase PIF1-like [Hydra vulgaris]|uniref:ATP-dependent DNA helicase n=1 Tax=Hydra vulgaris TaxID=6087 RepID=A0ABM4CA15_HYDVU
MDLLNKTFYIHKYEIRDLASCNCVLEQMCDDLNNKKMLSLQQQKALQWLDEGKTFFITGGAGCGKRKAAYLINGVTIHAFAGIETGVKSVDYYKRHMHPDIKKTWLETDVLIIDEISMINAPTFDLLHLIACEIRQCYDELFGGVQVIACGDFFQLPPVTGEFVFKSKIWQHYMTEVLVLTQCFRQKEDAQCFGALNEIRFGQVSDQTIDYFMTRCFEKDENLNSKYTKLFFRNIEVDCYNKEKMQTIKQEGYWFYAKDDVKNPNIPCTFQIPAAVYLKIGAIVMLVRNINVEEGLCNGTISTVILIENNAVWIKKMKFEYQTEETIFSNNSIYTEHFFFIKDDYKDEDIVEELQLYSETQSPDEIVYHVEQKTMEGFETQMKNSIYFADLFQNFFMGYNRFIQDANVRAVFNILENDSGWRLIRICNIKIKTLSNLTERSMMKLQDFELSGFKRKMFMTDEEIEKKKKRNKTYYEKN